MTAGFSAKQQVFGAMREAYFGLAISVPLVLAGILLTGSLYYFAFIRPHTDQRGIWALFAYLFPREHYSTNSARLDIGVWLLNGLIFIPVFEACVVVVGLASGVTFTAVLTQWFGSAARLTIAVPLAVMLQFAGFWLGQGIGQYSGHLAMHKVPILWALHRAHHSAESANLFTFLRSHPLEHFVNGATRVLGTALGTSIGIYSTGGALLPATTSTILWYGIIYVLAGFRSVDHLHIPVSYGRFLDVVIGSPVMHQVHHSAEERHRDVNMAGAGYLFDWLFGTLYIPSRGEVWRWGLNEQELGMGNPHQSLKAFFVEPLRTMRLELARMLRSGNAEPMMRDAEKKA